MDPRGVFIVFIHFLQFFRHAQIQIESRWCWQFVALAGTRSWDLEVVVVFSSYLCQSLLQIRCRFCVLHRLGPVTLLHR